jgi:carboxylate-amine ligase
MTTDEPFTIGVEEEYQIVHPSTRELRSRAQLILPEAQAALGKQVTPELYQSQIEIGTSICHTVAEVRANIAHLRGEVIAAAEKLTLRGIIVAVKLSEVEGIVPLTDAKA